MSSHAKPPPAAAPASKRTLALPEILDAILLYLKHHSDVNEWQDRQNEVAFAEPDLYHSAQVNHLWADQALKLLWREIPPSAVIHLNNMPLARQQNYAVMIRNITIDSTPGGNLFDDFNFCEQLRFPLVQDLTICFKGNPDWESLDKPESNSLPLNIRFPSVNGLTLTADNAHINEYYDEVQQAMENSLEELASAIRKWSALRSVVIDTVSVDNEFAFPFFGELARSPNLLTLTMKGVERGQMLSKYFLLWTHEASSSPFASLRHAEFACTRSDAMDLMRILASSPLEALTLSLCDMTGFAPVFPTAFPSIEWPASFTALTYLCIRLGDNNKIQGTDIVALGTFNNLRALSIVVAGTGCWNRAHNRYFPVLTSDLDDSMFATLCRSLPPLESLALHVESPITAASLLSCARSCRNLQKLTLSGIFDLVAVASLSPGGGNDDLFPELIKLEIGEISALVEYIAKNQWEQVVRRVSDHGAELLKIAPKMRCFSLFGKYTCALVDAQEFDFADSIRPRVYRPQGRYKVVDGVTYTVWHRSPRT